MRRGELSFEEEERFSRLCELPELLEGLGVGISGDSVNAGKKTGHLPV